jgi:hypothetical protein
VPSATQRAAHSSRPTRCARGRGRYGLVPAGVEPLACSSSSPRQLKSARATVVPAVSIQIVSVPAPSQVAAEFPPFLVQNVSAQPADWVRVQAAPSSARESRHAARAPSHAAGARTPAQASAGPPAGLSRLRRAVDRRKGTAGTGALDVLSRATDGAHAETARCLKSGIAHLFGPAHQARTASNQSVRASGSAPRDVSW